MDKDICASGKEELYIPTDKEIDCMFEDIQSEAKVHDIQAFRYLAIR